MKRVNQFFLGLSICLVVFAVAVLANRCANEFSQKPPFESDSIHIKKAEQYHDTAFQYFELAKAQIKALDSLKVDSAYIDSLNAFEARERERIRKLYRYPF